MSAIRVFRAGLVLGRQDLSVFWQNWKVWVIAWLVRVATTAIAWVLLGKLLGSDERLYYLLIGNAVIVGVQSASFAVAACTWDRMEGAYTLLVIAPTGMAPALMGRSSVWLLNGIASSLLTFAILVAIFGMPMPLPHSLFLPFAVIIVCISSYFFSIFLGSMVVHLFRLRSVVANISTILLTAFCGVNVPVAFWPGWIGMLAAFLPVTHGLQAIRVLLNQGAALDVATGLALEMMIGLAWLSAGFFTIERMANAGRRDGSIDFM